MKASEIIIEKLNNEPDSIAKIKQINGNVTNLYFLKEQDTFWSDNLYNVIGNGYSFDLFNILEEQSLGFPNKRMPKGNARNNKLGDPNCDINTAVGILGYLFFKKKDGESVLEPMHVIAAVLEWAGIAKNERGFIRFY
jgi:hypothetical protein